MSLFCHGSPTPNRRQMRCTHSVARMPRAIRVSEGEWVGILTFADPWPLVTVVAHGIMRDIASHCISCPLMSVGGGHGQLKAIRYPQNCRPASTLIFRLGLTPYFARSEMLPLRADQVPAQIICWNALASKRIFVASGSQAYPLDQICHALVPQWPDESRRLSMAPGASTCSAPRNSALGARSLGDRLERIERREGKQLQNGRARGRTVALARCGEGGCGGPSLPRGLWSTTYFWIVDRLN